MEAFFMLLGIIAMTGTTGWCITYGLWMQHKRESQRLAIEQGEVHNRILMQQKEQEEKFKLIEMAMEQKMLPARVLDEMMSTRQR